ncbi:MAG: hypothetical protein WBB45_04270 [Cyclobacteriaceae bacterium]
MNKYLPTQESTFELCQKDTCVKTTGKNADLLSLGVFIFLILAGLAAFDK